MSIDLHTHSVYSDGTKTPAELVLLASKTGVSALSVTDHDTMDGVAEAMVAGKEFDVEVIPGLEVSVLHKKRALHILGYFVDSTNEELVSALRVLQEARNGRNAKIIQKLQMLGIEATLAELNEISGVGQTGRPHIARLLMNHGVVKSMNQAFEHYLTKDAKAYVPRFAYSAEEAIGLITGAGGLAVLAHPIQIDRTLTVLQDLLPELQAFGLAGVETYYPTQPKNIRKKIRKYTQQYDLLLTGGSDYHGDIRPGTRLAGGNNVYVPPKLLEKMKARLKTLKSNQ